LPILIGVHGANVIQDGTTMVINVVESVMKLKEAIEIVKNNDSEEYPPAKRQQVLKYLKGELESIIENIDTLIEN
jgi:hypothetical protein